MAENDIVDAACENDPPLEGEGFSLAILAVMQRIARQSSERATSSPDYGELFEAFEHDGIKGVLRNLRQVMTRHALNASDIIQAELGRRLSNEEFHLLLALPFVVVSMEREIKDAEGLTCCVDKVYHRLSKWLIGSNE